MSGFSAAERDRRLRAYRSHLPSDIHVEVHVVEGTPDFFDRGDQFGDAISAAGTFFPAFDWSRFDAAIWAGAIDPGLAQVRAAAPIPVAGPGEAAMYQASVIGAPLSIVTVDEHAVAMSRRLVDQVPAKPRIVSIRSMAYPVRQIVNDISGATAALLREIEAARDEGAAAVYLGSMTLGTLGIDDRVRRSGIAVLNPIRIACRLAADILDSVPSGSGELA